MTVGAGVGMEIPLNEVVKKGLSLETKPQLHLEKKKPSRLRDQDQGSKAGINVHGKREGQCG